MSRKQGLYFEFVNGRWKPIKRAGAPSRSRHATTRHRARLVLTESRRMDIIEAADKTCTYCQVEGDWLRGPDGRYWHMDHIVPLSKGGGTDLSNVALSCASCNHAKGQRTPEEWRSA